MPLDRDAVRAVLDAAGAPPPALPALPAGLTERELEILRWLAAGRTKRQIAAELVISPSTVHTHTVHIYAKCGVSTRAGLAMFAMRHGLAARTGPAPAPRSTEQSIAPGGTACLRFVAGHQQAISEGAVMTSTTTGRVLGLTRPGDPGEQGMTSAGEQSMSAEQNIETARQMYEAFGRGDVQAILDRVTDDVDWSTDAAIAIRAVVRPQARQG